MSLIGSACEAFSIAIVFPFINILLSPEAAEEYPIVGNFIASTEYNQLIVISCAALLVVFLLKDIYLSFMYYVQSRFVYHRQVVFWGNLLRNYLNKPYPFYFTRNIAELQRNFTTSINCVINGVFMPFVILFCEFFVVLFMVSILLFVEFLSCIIVVTLLTGVLLLLLAWQKKNMTTHGQKKQIANFEMLKWTNQSILGIKNIKVRDNQEYYIDRVKESGKDFSDAAIYSGVMQQIPRLFIEIVAILILCVVIVANLIMGRDVQSILPVITLFAATAYRLMPSLNRMISQLNIIRFDKAALDNVYDDLFESNHGKNINISVPAPDSFVFKKDIEIKNLSFSYNDDLSNVIDNISLRISRGSKVGVIGGSGQGKTTFLDLLLGLLEPKSGDILVDGQSIYKDMRAWHQFLSYIPQETYLIDDSIINNIALGVRKNEIDFARVKEVIKNAQLQEFVDTLPNGLNTVIGDNGICISGGQRQRIAIARALYTRPQILILDEATSALDNQTESDISDTLDMLGQKEDITMIVVAHRLSTIEKCDKIYKLENGRIKEVSKDEL